MNLYERLDSGQKNSERCLYCPKQPKSGYLGFSVNHLNIPAKEIWWLVQTILSINHVSVNIRKIMLKQNNKEHIRYW